MPPPRILLVGASGFVGRHLGAALAAVYPDADLMTPGFDLRDADEVAAAVRDGMPDVCLHLAAISTVAKARQDETTAWQVNLHGTLHLAHAILRHAPACHLLFVSSSEVYGGSQGSSEPTSEDRPLAPRNIYAATKAAADLALGSMAADGLHVTRLRPFNHTGPGQSADFVIPAFARQIARIAAGLQPPVLQVGDVEAWRDFLDVRDVCRAYLACIDKRDTLPAGGILNIGSGQSRRIGDVLTELLDVAGVAAEVRTDPSRLRNTRADRFFANAERAHALLGWSPQIPWRETLRSVLDDWKARIAPDSST